MPDPRMQFITAHKDIGLIAGFGKLSSSGDMLDATIRKISNSTAQLAQSGAEVKISLIEQGTTFKGLEKKLNEYGIQSTQQTQKQIAEVEALAIAYQKHPAVLKQLQNVHQQLNLSLKEGVNSTKMQTFAMQNFSFIAQDAAQFSMGMSQGIRAIANNLDATLFSMIRLSEASDGWGNAMKAMGKQLMSPLGILVGLNIATSLYQILSQQMQKNKVVAEDYKELLGELVEIQNDSVKITFLAGQASEAYRKALERNVEIIDETIHGSKILQKQRQSEFVGIRERASFAAGILDKLDKEEIETLRIRLNVGKEVIEQLEKEADRRMVLDEGYKVLIETEGREAVVLAQAVAMLEKANTEYDQALLSLDALKTLTGQQAYQMQRMTDVAEANIKAEQARIMISTLGGREMTKKDAIIKGQTKLWEEQAEALGIIASADLTNMIALQSLINEGLRLEASKSAAGEMALKERSLEIAQAEHDLIQIMALINDRAGTKALVVADLRLERAKQLLELEERMAREQIQPSGAKAIEGEGDLRMMNLHNALQAQGMINELERRNVDLKDEQLLAQQAIRQEIAAIHTVSGRELAVQEARTQELERQLEKALLLQSIAAGGAMVPSDMLAGAGMDTEQARLLEQQIESLDKRSASVGRTIGEAWGQAASLQRLAIEQMGGDTAAWLLTTEDGIKAMSGSFGTLFGGLSDLSAAMFEASGKDSERMFNMHKAFAIGQAVINTYEAATKAWAQGGIFGGIAAVGVIAAGMALVAKIASTKPGDSASGGGGRTIPNSIGGNAAPATPIKVSSIWTTSNMTRSDRTEPSNGIMYGSTQTADIPIIASMQQQPAFRTIGAQGNIETVVKIDLKGAGRELIGVIRNEVKSQRNRGISDPLGIN